MAASKRLAESALFVDDSSDLSVLDVRAKTRRLAQQQADGLGLVLIDYLQLMRATGHTDNRAEQVGQISRGLKTLARELEVPVIASRSSTAASSSGRTSARCSPISASPARSSRTPTSSCSSTATSTTTRSPRTRGWPRSIISKHRNGGLGTVKLTFQKEYPRFMSYVGEELLGRGGLPRRPLRRLRLPLRRRAPARARVHVPPARIARRKRAAKLEGRIPSRYQGSRSTASRTLDRARTDRRARGAQVRRHARREARRGPRHLVQGRRRHGQDDAGDADLQGAAMEAAARWRSTRSRGCSGCCARPSTTTSEASLNELLDRLAAVDLLHIDDVGAEQTLAVGARAALHDRQHALRGRPGDRCSPRTSDDAELQEQIGERTVSRLNEMCGDPLPLFGNDHRASIRPSRPGRRWRADAPSRPGRAAPRPGRPRRPSLLTAWPAS